MQPGKIQCRRGPPAASEAGGPQQRPCINEESAGKPTLSESCKLILFLRIGVTVNSYQHIL